MIFPLFSNCLLNDFNGFDNNSLMNYKVLYIGKSIENSNAFLRTRKHPKLQQILSDTHNSREEVIILLATIQAPYNISITHSDFTNSEYNNDNSLKNLNELIKSHGKKGVVNLMEACLIKYFAPKHNEYLKNTPIKGSELFIKKYKKVFDVNTILTVVDTSELPNVHLFSEKQQPSNIHKIYNTIHTENQRITLKDILEGVD